MAPPELLQAIGLKQLREIELTEDSRWPMLAVGSDPQLRFAPPAHGGAFRITVSIEAEDGVVAPSVYLNTGSGFADAHSVPLRRLVDHTWQGECDTTLPCLAWRLDPLDRPGRFRVSALQIDPLWTNPQRQLPVWMRRAGKRMSAAMQQLRLRHGREDLCPANDVIRPHASPHRYLATGSDPQLRLPHPLQAGWYMLEVTLQLPAARAVARLYLDDSRSGEEEAHSAGLPLRSGVLTKRLVRLNHRARVRFDPMAAAGAFEISHFRLARVADSFARQRMQDKLQARHPRYRDQARTAPRTEASADVDMLWNDYTALFESRGDELVRYADWIRDVETPARLSDEMQRQRIGTWSWQPTFSLVMPTYNSNEAYLLACIDSVRAQTYPHWTLCIADDASTRPGLRKLLGALAESDPRIRVALREQNGHISAASNTALSLATGEFMALLDHDDVLASHALFAVAEALQSRPTAALLYSDEDKLDETGTRCDPCFKPGWSPDLLYAQNCFSHLGVYRRSLVDAVGGFRVGFEGSQDHDLVLRCAAQVGDPRDIVHIPQVLYHWRMAEGSTARGHDRKDYASEAGRRALQDHFDVCHPGVDASVVAPGIYRHRWPLPADPPLVSLIIPTRDGCDLLRTCIESIVQRSAYTHYELLVVDNQSSCPRTLAYLSALESGAAAEGRARVLRWDHPFNYSAINNFAATQARGSVLGLINNDIEVISPDWLGEMVRHALRPDVGCVGAKLYYPDDTVQHAGVVLGVGGVANHALRGAARTSPGYFGRLWTVCNPSAVTGAVLLVRKQVFDAVGGLDAEGLPVAFNDVDLCLKAMAAGYRTVWTPHAELYHHESVSRGTDTTPEKRARFLGEVAVMQARWSRWLLDDPHYNPNLTRLREDYSLASATEDIPHRPGLRQDGTPR
ncbi:glycosyltransferase [Sphaerotilus sp.]|uniref:glycosyltransferase family 2 protein n=1 Tax=Sphaerotilus sp. TaxID=2093942 RepID=UPI0034E19655